MAAESPETEIENRAGARNRGAWIFGDSMYEEVHVDGRVGRLGDDGYKRGAISDLQDFCKVLVAVSREI